MSTGPTFGHSLEKKHVQRPMAGVRTPRPTGGRRQARKIFGCVKHLQSWSQFFVFVHDRRRSATNTRPPAQWTSFRSSTSNFFVFSIIVLPPVCRLYGYLQKIFKRSKRLETACAKQASCPVTRCVQILQCVQLLHFYNRRTRIVRQ